MERFVRKSAIPESKTFVIRDLIAPHFDPKWHFHPEYQLFLVLKGRGTRFVGDQIKPFRENDMVFTGPNLPHLWRNDDWYFKKNESGQTRGIVIYFQPDLLLNLQNKEEMESIHHLLQLSARGIEIKGETNRLVSRWMIELLTLKGVPSIIQLLRILDILAKSGDCTPLAHAGYVNLNKESETGRMTLVYEHVMKNFKQRLPLEEVASLTNMSVSSFSRYFKSRANKSFSNFLSEIRIGHACKMLHEENTSISQVSDASGFPTLSNFNKQFKEITGKTPLQYKKAYLEQFRG